MTTSMWLKLRRTLVTCLRETKIAWMRAREQIRLDRLKDAQLRTRQQAFASYLASHSLRKLQIGAGENPLPGWLNTDLEPVIPGVLYLDALERLPFPNETFDYVFSEHMIEHIPYSHGVQMLKEIFRILRVGGRVRIATPDVVNIVGLLADSKSEAQRRYLEWNSRNVMGLYSPEKSPLQRHHPEWDLDHQHIQRFFPDAQNDTACFVVNNFFRSYGHQFLYDARTLRAALEAAGFVDIIQLEPDESPDENLRGIDAHQRLIGAEMNRIETMVFEAIRPA